MAKISKQLHELANARRSEEAIVNAFFAAARSVADRRISITLKHRISPTEIANSAIKSAMQDVANGKVRASTDDFRAYLFRLVENKTLDRIAEQKAAKRDADRTVTLADPSTIADERPDMRVAAEELGARAAVDLLTAFERNDPKSIKRYAVVLGVLLDMRPAAVRSALLDYSNEEDVPSLRLIQVLLREGRAHLFRFLKAEAAEDV